MCECLCLVSECLWVHGSECCWRVGVNLSLNEENKFLFSDLDPDVGEIITERRFSAALSEFKLWSVLIGPCHIHFRTLKG